MRTRGFDQVKYSTTSEKNNESVSKIYENVAYESKSEKQKMDIYLPSKAEGPLPVIIALHGGAFMKGHKNGYDIFPILKGLKKEYAVVSVGYRLSGEAKFPAAISDVKAAIRFLKANAVKYNLDTERFAVWGGSAGGNLAALIGTSAKDSYLNGDNRNHLDQSSSVKAVVDWFGPIDFLTMDEQFEKSTITPLFGPTNSETSPESLYIGGRIGEWREQTMRANPTTYISEDAPCFLIQHGTDDRHIPLQQSIDFANALKRVIGPEKVELHILDGAIHGGEAFECEENLDVVFNFLKQCLK